VEIQPKKTKLAQSARSNLKITPEARRGGTKNQ